MRSALGLLILLIVSISFVSCKSRVRARDRFLVALVLDKGGVDDKSFNASAYQGASQARAELGVELRVSKRAMILKSNPR